MKKSMFIFLFVLFNVSLSIAQRLPQPGQTLLPNWKRIYIKNVGYIDMPPTMEVQQGKYKEFANKDRKIEGYGEPQLVIQQKGLNEFKKEALDKYARVIIETTKGAPREYEKLNFDISTITQSEISELNSTYKQQIQQNLIQTGSKIIEWYPLKVGKVNGMSCIHVSYIRQFNDKPYVLNHIYIFHNYDRMHALTMSYRLSEANFWEADFAKILKSFRITNVK